MSWYYVALLVPLLYAIVNLLDDNLLSFVYKSPYLACVVAGLCGSLPLLSRFFIHADSISAPLAMLSFGAGFLTLAYYFFYFKGLQSDTPSVVVALFGLAPATIPFLAHVFVGEQLVGLEIVGFVVVLLASLGLAVTDVKKLRFSKAFVPVLIAIVFVDAVSVTTKYVYQRADFYPAYLYFCLGMGIGGIIFLFLKFSDNARTIREIANSIHKLLPILIVAELVGLSAEFTLNFATSRGPVSLVKVIEGTQPMFVLLLSLGLYPLAPRYFREAKSGQLARKLACMVVIVAGLALISIATKT